MIVYEGVRTQRGCRVIFTDEDMHNATGEVPTRYDLRNHSPIGFEWGYSGSGAAQLALALLAHALGDDARACRLYHLFKIRQVANWSAPRWRITSAEIQEWARQVECATQYDGETTDREQQEGGG